MINSVTRQRVRVPLLVLAVPLGGVAAGALAWWGRDHEEAGLIAAMAIIAVLPIVVRVAQRRWDPFEPINVGVVAILVMFVGRPIAEVVWNVNTYPGYEIRAGFDQAMLIALVALPPRFTRAIFRAPAAASRIDSIRCPISGTPLDPCGSPAGS